MLKSRSQRDLRLDICIMPSMEVEYQTTTLRKWTWLTPLLKKLINIIISGKLLILSEIKSTFVNPVMRVKSIQLHSLNLQTVKKIEKEANIIEHLQIDITHPAMWNISSFLLSLVILICFVINLEFKNKIFLKNCDDGLQGYYFLIRMDELFD